jgi:hypothetical protein
MSEKKEIHFFQTNYTFCEMLPSARSGFTHLKLETGLFSQMSVEVFLVSERFTTS